MARRVQGTHASCASEFAPLPSRIPRNQAAREIRLLNRYTTEFEGRYNIRKQDTADQLTMSAQPMDGKRLRYCDRIEPNGLDSEPLSA